MSAVVILEVVQVLNGLLALGVNGLVAAQKVGRVLESAVAENRPISAEEWEAVVTDAKQANDRLAEILSRGPGVPR